MKKKIVKILFIVSFLPYIIIVLVSLYFAIFGYDVYRDLGIPDTMVVEFEYIKTEYGINVFLDFLKGLVYIYSVWIPILPVMLIYQIIYVIIKRRYFYRQKKE